MDQVYDSASDNASEYCDTLSFPDRVVKGFCQFVLRLRELQEDDKH